MKFEVKSVELSALQLKISGMPRQLSTRTILRTAVLPTLNEARSRAPIGDSRPLYGREKSSPLTYQRGGRLRQDLRIKMVSDRADEVTALVGVSQRNNKVGWRAHFTLFGTVKMHSNNFLDAAFVRTRGEVQARFDAAVGRRVKRML